jgi:hypothetical protein
MCQSCHKVYIGQTGRSLNIRYTEHIRSIRYNKEDSAFAQHILNTGHQYGPIEHIMELIEKANEYKRKLLHLFVQPRQLPNTRAKTKYR